MATKKPKVAIVYSYFYQDLMDKMLQGTLQTLKKRGFTVDQITTVKVPGAIESPIVLQRLAKTKKYAALICLGAVIYGETKHFDYVCKQVSDGCQHVALTYDIPVIFGVLTTNNMKQAWDRVGGKTGHMGKQAAETALEMINILSKIK